MGVAEKRRGPEIMVGVAAIVIEYLTPTAVDGVDASQHQQAADGLPEADGLPQ